MKRPTIYRLDGETVNSTTLKVSLFVRALFYVLGLVLVAASTPLSFGATLGLGVAFVCFMFAKETVLTFADDR